MADLSIIVKAKDEAKKTLAGVEGAASKVTGAFKALGSVAAVGALAIGFKKLINDTVSTGDALDKMSKRVGISSKTLSEWSHVAQLGGTSIQGLEASFRRLSRNLAGAVEGNKTAQKAFDDMGLSIRDSSGKLKTAEELLIESADAMTKIDGEANKVSASFNLFGIAGTKMIPILDQGSDAIREQIEEAHNLGVVMDEEAVKAAVDFADAMTRLKGAITGLVNKAVVPLLSPLENMVKQFTALVSLNFKQLAIELGLVRGEIDKMDPAAKKMKKIGDEGRKMLHDLRPDIFSKEWADAGEKMVQATDKSSKNQIDRLEDAHQSFVDMKALDAQIQKQFTEQTLKDLEDKGNKEVEIDKISKEKKKEVDDLLTQMGLNNMKLKTDTFKGLTEYESEVYQENLQAQTDAANAAFLERENKARETAEKMIQMEQFHAQVISDAVGDAFRQVFESGKKGADDFGRVMIRMLLQVIAKLAVAQIMASSLSPMGGGLLAGAVGGIFAGIGGLFQTSPGMTKIVPGSPLQAVPIIAHGGEEISRGGGGGTTVIVQGSLFNSEETIEAIRSGLQNQRFNTGKTV